MGSKIKTIQILQAAGYILLGLFLGLTAFWNGAALIGGLLIIAGLAVFSDGKLDYVICGRSVMAAA